MLNFENIKKKKLRISEYLFLVNMLNWQPHFWKWWLYIIQLFAYVSVSVWPRGRLFRWWESAAGLKSGAPGSFSLHTFFLSKLVLIDRQTFCPFSVRVQCGCLVNEVDFKDYNQRGDITDHMCQRRWANLPGSWCQKDIFCFLAVLIYHRAIQIRVTAPQGWLKPHNVYDR